VGAGVGGEQGVGMEAGEVDTPGGAQGGSAHHFEFILHPNHVDRD